MFDCFWLGVVLCSRVFGCVCLRFSCFVVGVVLRFVAWVAIISICVAGFCLRLRCFAVVRGGFDGCVAA